LCSNQRDEEWNPPSRRACLELGDKACLWIPEGCLYVFRDITRVNVITIPLGTLAIHYQEFFCARERERESQNERERERERERLRERERDLEREREREAGE
jgi:hypothetical protein